MGYSQHWQGKFILSDETQIKIRKLISAAQANGVSICGPDGKGTPDVTDFLVAFNGDASKDEDYESFYLDTNPDMNWGFCKTARKPYDALVCAVLLVVHEANPNTFTFRSEGSWDHEAEWIPARDLYFLALGENPDRPTAEAVYLPTVAERKVEYEARSANLA